MGKYAGAASTAYSLLAKKGLPLPLLRKNDVSFDPVTQQEVASTTTYTFRAAVLPPGKSAEYDVGSLVGKNAIRILLALKDMPIEPQPGDVVTYKGGQWTIFWTKTYDPAADGAILTVAYAEG